MAAIAEWIHYNGIAYPVTDSNICKVWQFEGKFKVVTKVQRALSPPYKDGTQYINYEELIFEDREIFKKLCEKLGCNYEKIVAVNHQKFQKTGGNARTSNYNKSADSDDGVPF